MNILQVVHNIVKAYVGGEYDDGSLRVPLDYVRFCSVYLELFEQWIQRQPTQQDKLVQLSDELGGDVSSATLELRAWSTLWESLGPAIARYQAKSGWSTPSMLFAVCNQTMTSLPPEQVLAQDRELAETCLRRIHAIESGDSSDCVPNRASIFPDELVMALGSFIDPEKASEFPRLRRVECSPEPQLVTSPVPRSSEETVEGAESGVSESSNRDECEGT